MIFGVWGVLLKIAVPFSLWGRKKKRRGQ